MGLTKRKGSHFWYARGNINGEQFNRKTTATWHRITDNAGPAAMKEYQRVYNQFADELAKRSGETLSVEHLPATLETLETLFFKEHESRHTRPKTLQGYRWIWNCLRKHLGTLESALSPRGLTEYVAKRSRMVSATTGTLISPRTVRAEVKQFFAAYRYALDFGLALPPIPPWPKNFQEDREPNEARSGKYHPPKRLWAFIALLPSQEAKDRVLFHAATGIRFEELAKLDQHKLRLSEKYTGVAAFLILPADVAKGKRKRIVGLTPDALAVYRRNQPFKSRTNRTAWRTASRKLGLPSPLHARDLRASFASGVTIGGASETHRDMVMGHWRGQPSTYQKARWLAAAKVARAVGRWLAKGHAAWVRGASAEHLPKVAVLGQNRKCV